MNPSHKSVQFVSLVNRLCPSVRERSRHIEFDACVRHHDRQRKARTMAPSIFILFCVLLAVGFLSGCTSGGGGGTLTITVATANNVTTVAQGQSIQITATLTNAQGNSAVTWSLTGPSCPNSCGSLSSASSNPTTYLAPNAVAANFMVTITATSAKDPSKTASVTLTVTPPPQIAVSFTTAPPVNLSVNTPANVVAHVANDSTNAGIDWTLTCGGGTCGTITGHTGSDATNVYTAPASVPPAAVTIKAASTADPSKSISAMVTITAAVTGNALLNGPYAFIFNGVDGSSGASLSIGGTFTADGNGNISVGNEDINLLSGVNTNVAFTGTYSIGADNRGTMTFTTTVGNVTTKYSIAVNSSGNGSFIEFDASGFTGVEGSGVFKKQDMTAFSLAAFNGSFAVGLSGELKSGADRLIGLGVFTSDATGTLSNGQMDVARQDSHGNPVAVTGNLFAITASGRGTATLNVATFGAFNFTFYVVSATEAFVLEVDLRGGAIPLLSGSFRKQSGEAFSNASANGAAVFQLNGMSFAGAPLMVVGRVVTDGAGNLTGDFDQNDNGTVLTDVMFSGTYNIAANGRGTFTFVINPTTSQPYTFYMIGPNQAFLLGGQPGAIDPNAPVGMLEPQTGGPFSNASLSTGFTGATITESSNFSAAEALDAALALDGAGNLAGTLDHSSCMALSPNVATNGTYSSDMNGRGTLTATGLASGGTQLRVVSPNKFYLIVPFSCISSGVGVFQH